MPQKFDVEGVGTLEFPDEATQDQIWSFIDTNFNKKKPEAPSGPIAALEHTAAGILPGAGFMAAAVPGAELGAMAGAAFGPAAPVAIPVLGAVGGMATGMMGQKAVDWAQRALGHAVAPEFTKKAEAELAAGEQAHPWWSAAGDVASMGASAKTAPLKALKQQLPLRLALGGAAAVGIPVIEQHRLPTAPEFVAGVTMGTIFGESRFSGKEGVPRPQAPADVRRDRERTQIGLAKEAGHDWQFTDQPLANKEDVVNIQPGTTTALVNRPNFHQYLEQEIPKKMEPEVAMKDLVEHETKHSVTGPEKAKELWGNLSPYQQYLFKRTLDGPDWKNRPRSDEYYGAEYIRFYTQLLRTKSATEFISSIPAENRTSKFLTQIQSAVQWTRENLGSNTSKEAMRRNQEILDEVDAKAEAVKAALKKGGKDALVPEAAQPVRDVRAQPGEVQGQVPTTEAGPQNVPGGGKTRVALSKEVLLKRAEEQAKVIEGLQPGEAIIESGVWFPGMKEPEYGPHHPGIVEALEKKYNRPGLADQYKTKKSRDNSLFGYRTNLRDWVARTELKLKSNGKYPHSNDIPSIVDPEITVSEQAPPAAPTVGAQTTQRKSGLATTVPVELTTPTTGTAAAKTTISTAFPESKMRELEQLNREVVSPEFKWDQKKYDRWVELSNELDAAEAAAGAGPGPQAMSMKSYGDEKLEKGFYTWAEADRFLRDQSAKNPDRKYVTVGVGARWEVHSRQKKAGGPIAKEITDFSEDMKEAKPYSTPQALNVGMKAMSIADLDRLLQANNYVRSRFAEAYRQKDIANLGKWSNTQIPREAIEAAVNFGSNNEKMLSGMGVNLGDRPMDWRKNPEVAQWILDNAEKLRWNTEDNAQELAEVKASLSQPQAMASKGLRDVEGELTNMGIAAKLVQIVGGIADNPEKKALVTKTFQEIVAMPPDQRPQALTDFHFKYKQQEIEAAQRQVLANELGFTGTDLTTALSQENIQAQFGKVDRVGAYKGALYLLNRKIRPIAPEAKSPTKAQLEEEARTGKPVSRAVTPRYDVGDYKEFWDDLHEKQPHVPEVIAREIWSTAVHDVLQNASSERIKELLRPARLEKRILGNMPAPQKGEPDMRRPVAEPDLSPMLSEIAGALEKGENPLTSKKFERFLATRDMTLEDGLALVKKYDLGLTKELKSKAAHLEQRTAPQRGRVVEKQGKVSFVERGVKRDPTDEAAAKDLDKMADEALKLAKKRRLNAIDLLSEWLIKPSIGPEKTAARPKVDSMDIFTETRAPGGPYAEYTPSQGEDGGFLRKTLGRGGQVEGMTETTTRSVTILVDRKTGEHHAVSTYVNKEGSPLFYDPMSPAGSKEHQHVNLSKVLASFRVRGHLLVRDPVNKFHQIWNPLDMAESDRMIEGRLNDIAEKRKKVKQANPLLKPDELIEKVPDLVIKKPEAVWAIKRNPNLEFKINTSGEAVITGIKPKAERKYPTSEQMYLDELGTVAKLYGDASGEQWAKYNKGLTEQREKEIEEAHARRFGTEQEVEEAKKPEGEEGEEEEPETKPRPEKEESIAARQELKPGDVEVEEETDEGKSLRERMIAERAARGETEWEAGQDWDPENLEGRQTALTRAAMESWKAATETGRELRDKSGQARLEAPTYFTDPRHLSYLSETPLDEKEAIALWDLWRELKIKNPIEMVKMLDYYEGGVSDVIRQKGVSDVIKERRPLKILRGRDLESLSAISKIQKQIYERIKNSPTERAKRAKFPPIPEDTEYKDMTPGEKEHYKHLEDLKYRSLIRLFYEIHQLVEESSSGGPRAEAAAGKGVSLPEDVVRFRTRAIDRYGDKTRSAVEQAAVSAQPFPEQTGERSILAGSKYGGTPRVRGAVLSSMPRPSEAGGELSPESAQFAEQQARIASPYIPTAPGYQKPLLTPAGKGNISKMTQLERGLPSTRTMHDPFKETPTSFTGDYEWSGKYSPTGGGREAGFVPRKPSIRELMGGPPPKKPLAMTLKGFGPANRYQQEIYEQGRRGKIPGIPYKAESKEETIAKGREAVLSGEINPVKEMAQAKRTGYMSERSTTAFRYWGYRLLQHADAMRESGSKQDAAQAQRMYDQWMNDMRITSKRLFAKTGHGLQGWNQIGPDDMKSTTFVKNQARRAKGIREGRGDDDDLPELTPEQEKEAEEIAKSVANVEGERKILETTVGQAADEVDNPKPEPGTERIVNLAEEQGDRAERQAAQWLRDNKPPKAMARKADKAKLEPLSPEAEDMLGNIGMRVMQKLSKANAMTDARWLDEMKKRLREPDIDRPDLEPYLPHIRATAEKFNETFINNIVGTGHSGAATADVKKMLSRKLPPLEESKAAISRAMQADPSGRHISPSEAYHVWNYLRQRFLMHVDPKTGQPDPILDFKEIRLTATQELGIIDPKTGKVPDSPEFHYNQLRFFRALSSNRTMREPTRKLIEKMTNEARVKSQALNWLKNQEFPGWLRTARMFPRLFFWDKIMGHGLVPMITHAPTMMFNPKAWSVYFGHWREAPSVETATQTGKTSISQGKVWVPGAWQQMYRMQFGTKPFSRLASKVGLTKWEGVKAGEYHRAMMEEMTSDKRFLEWKKANLECDPFKYSDDYTIEALQHVFGDKATWITEGRGFDALKTLRYAMAEKWYNKLPEHLQNRESMELIADSVNHATGIVKTRFHESLNWLMFAPKLEASRWAYTFKDTAKAVNYVAKWRTSSLEQRNWAMSELMQKGAILGFYAGMLGMNQAFLRMCNSDQKINGVPEIWGGAGFDPTKPDFLAFKVAGFKVGVASPFVGMFKLLAHALHIAAGERTKFEKLQSKRDAMLELGGRYALGKASPIASFATQVATAEDFQRRPLPVPWAEDLSYSRKLRGEQPYTPLEYGLETFLPIPLEEGIKDIFLQLDMPDWQATRLLRTLTIAGGMGLTGARISEDQEE